MPAKQPESGRCSGDKRRFGRSGRLLSGGDFQAVFNTSEFRVAHRNFLLLATANKLNHPRIGLVVAKKNVRLAVSRNRIKRVARETFRNNWERLGNLDVVFLAKKGIDKLSRAEQTDLLNKGWSRLSRELSRDAENREVKS